MEAVEDAERQRHPLHHRPGQEAIEIQLNRVGDHFLSLEGVDDPHGDIADEQEGDNLSARLAAVMFRQVHAATSDVCDEQQLEHNLDDGEVSGDHDQQVGFTGHGGKGACDDGEHSIHKQPESRHSLQDVVEVTLVFTLELEALHSDKSDDDSNDAEPHEGTVGDICEVDGQQTELRVVDEHEE